MNGETPGISEEEARRFIGHTKSGDVIEQVEIEDPYRMANPKAEAATHEEVDEMIRKSLGREPVPKDHVMTEAELEMKEELDSYKHGEHNN
jgi:hypothetical protein